MTTPKLSTITQLLTAINTTESNSSSTALNYVGLVTKPTEVPIHFRYWSVLTSLFVAVLGVPGNLLTILAILVYKDLHKQANIFIFNLALADLIMAGYAAPAYAYANIRLKEFDLVHQKLFVVLKFTSVGTALLSIGCITIERYVTIVHPLKRKYLLHPVCMAAMVTFTWLYPLTLLMLAATNTLGTITWIKRITASAFINEYNGKDSHFTTIFNTSVLGAPLVIMIFCYVCIAKEVRNAGKNLNLKRNDSRASFKPVDRDLKLVKTVAILVFVFVITFGPFLLLGVLDPTIKNITIRRIAAAFMQSNAWVNAFVYAWIKSNFRQAYKLLLTCHCGKLDRGRGKLEKRRCLRTQHTTFVSSSRSTGSNSYGSRIRSVSNTSCVTRISSTIVTAELEYNTVAQHNARSVSFGNSFQEMENNKIHEEMATKKSIELYQNANQSELMLNDAVTFF